MKKALFFMIAAVLCLVFLTSCGTHSIKVTGDDGVEAVITYTSAVAFQRAPVFERSGGTVYMTFNGRTWYGASIIGKAEAESFSDPIAVSSNIKVYETGDENGFPFAYVLDLSGTDESFVKFLSNTSPAESDYGNDFTTSTEFSAGGTVTVPDTEFTLE